MRSAVLTMAIVALLFSAAAEARFPSKAYINDYNRDKQSVLAGAVVYDENRACKK